MNESFPVFEPSGSVKTDTDMEVSKERMPYLIRVEMRLDLPTPSSPTRQIRTSLVTIVYFPLLSVVFV